MRPLDRLQSIKVKLGVVIVSTVAGTVIVLAIGFRLGWSLELRCRAALIISGGTRAIVFQKSKVTAVSGALMPAAPACRPAPDGRRGRSSGCRRSAAGAG